VKSRDGKSVNPCLDVVPSLWVLNVDLSALFQTFIHCRICSSTSELMKVQRFKVHSKTD